MISASITKKWPWFSRVHENGRAQVQAECSDCGAVAHNSNSGMDPVMFAKILQHKGWSIGPNAKKPACPKCVSKAKMLKKKGNNTMSEIEKIKVEDLQRVGPTGPQNREIYSILDSFFDEKKGIYRDGYSDEQVSKDVGLARDVIVKIRSEAFGPLKAPQELSDLKDEIAIAKKLYAEEMNRLETKLDAELKKYG